MTTLAALTDEVLLGLSSYGLVQQRYAQITVAALSSATTLTVSTTTGFEVGHTAEVGDELLYVTDIDSAGSTITVVRGFRSTTAAAVANGDLVSCNPLWPRWMVQRAINDAITKAYPTLFAVTSTTLTGDALTVAYTMPDSCEQIQEVSFQDLNGTSEWVSYSQYRYDYARRTLNLHVNSFDGQDISVYYRTRPIAITSAQNLTDSGLSDSARSYVVARAMADLVSRMDSHRLQVNYASAADMAANRPSGSATTTARTLLALAQMELQEERKRLTAQYPPVVVTAKGRN